MQRQTLVLDKPPIRPGSNKIKPLTMSFSQPQLAGISSLLASAAPSSSALKRLPEETRTVKIGALTSMHSRMLSKGSMRSLQSRSRGDYENRDEFALGEYHKQEIRRARGMIYMQHPYWFIDSWYEDEVAEKKLSRMCTPRTPTESYRDRQAAWEQEMQEKLFSATCRPSAM